MLPHISFSPSSPPFFFHSWTNFGFLRISHSMMLITLPSLLLKDMDSKNKEIFILYLNLENSLIYKTPSNSEVYSNQISYNFLKETASYFWKLYEFRRKQGNNTDSDSSSIRENMFRTRVF